MCRLIYYARIQLPAVFYSNRPNVTQLIKLTAAIRPDRSSHPRIEVDELYVAVAIRAQLVLMSENASYADAWVIVMQVVK